MGEFPECFTEHIIKANNELTEPYTETKLKEYTSNIKKFLYHMLACRLKRGGRIRCQDLIEFTDIIPTAECLLNYKTDSD